MSAPNQQDLMNSSYLSFHIQSAGPAGSSHDTSRDYHRFCADHVSYCWFKPLAAANRSSAKYYSSTTWFARPTGLRPDSPGYESHLDNYKESRLRLANVFSCSANCFFENRGWSVIEATQDVDAEVAHGRRHGSRLTLRLQSLITFSIAFVAYLSNLSSHPGTPSTQHHPHDTPILLTSPLASQLLPWTYPTKDAYFHPSDRMTVLLYLHQLEPVSCAMALPRHFYVLSFYPFRVPLAPPSHTLWVFTCHCHLHLKVVL